LTTLTRTEEILQKNFKEKEKNIKKNVSFLNKFEYSLEIKRKPPYIKSIDKKGAFSLLGKTKN
jgi:hypothetical protein